LTKTSKSCCSSLPFLECQWPSRTCRRPTLTCSLLPRRNSEQNRPALQRITSRLVKEPLIPIGCALTVAAFTNAYIAMRKGDHARVQRMFRARVAAQAFTVVAMVAGGYYFADERHRAREHWKREKEREAEEKRLKWIRELEVRDEEDKAVKEVMKKRRQRKDEHRAAKMADGGDGTEADAAQARDKGRGEPAADEHKEDGTSVFAAVTKLLGGSGGRTVAQSTEGTTPMDDARDVRDPPPASKK
jgi:hypothetical protein